MSISKDKLSMITSAVHEIDAGTGNLRRALEADKAPEEFVQSFQQRVEQIRVRLWPILDAAKETYLKMDDQTCEKVYQELALEVQSVSQDLYTLADTVAQMASLSHTQCIQVASRVKRVAKELVQDFGS